MQWYINKVRFEHSSSWERNTDRDRVMHSVKTNLSHIGSAWPVQYPKLSTQKILLTYGIMMEASQSELLRTAMMASHAHLLIESASLTRIGCRKLVTLVANLSQVPKKQIQKRTGADRRKYYYADYEIRARFLSAAIEWSLWFKGKCYGTVRAKYE